jgi:hypothetical protein
MSFYDCTFGLCIPPQDCCDIDIGNQTVSNHSARSHPQSFPSPAATFRKDVRFGCLILLPKEYALEADPNYHYLTFSESQLMEVTVCDGGSLGSSPIFFYLYCQFGLYLY